MAQHGAVRAELYYATARGKYNALRIRNEGVRIIRNGIVLNDTQVPSLGLQCPPCEPIPLGYYLNSSSLQVRDLNGDGEPEVLLNVSSGGNICCRYTIVYSYRAQSTSYTRAVQNWGDWGGIPPMRDLSHNGVVEWVSGDGRFRYAFACGGCSPYLDLPRFAGHSGA